MYYAHCYVLTDILQAPFFDLTTAQKPLQQLRCVPKAVLDHRGAFKSLLKCDGVKCRFAKLVLLLLLRPAPRPSKHARVVFLMVN